MHARGIDSVVYAKHIAYMGCLCFQRSKTMEYCKSLEASSHVIRGLSVVLKWTVRD